MLIFAVLNVLMANAKFALQLSTREGFEVKVSEALHAGKPVIASRTVHQRMLDFAARHGVRPVVQTYPMTRNGIEEALEALREGKVRYRGVLVAQD